jgi:hypothetical protein
MIRITTSTSISVGDDDFIRREGGERVLDGLEGVGLGDLARNVEVVADAVEGRLQANARLIQGTVDSACQAGAAAPPILV